MKHKCPQCGTAFAEAVLSEHPQPEWCKAGEFGCECGRSEYESCPLPHPRTGTPRTDEQVALVARTIKLVGVAPDGGLGDVDVVTGDFARELERELEQALRSNDTWHAECERLKDIELRREEYVAHRFPPDYLHNDWVAIPRFMALRIAYAPDSSCSPSDKAILLKAIGL